MKLFKIKYSKVDFGTRFEYIDYIVCNSIVEAIKQVEENTVEKISLEIKSIKGLASEELGPLHHLTVVGNYHDEMVVLTEDVIELLEKLSNTNDNELDCDRKSCVLRDARRLHDKLIDNADKK